MATLGIAQHTKKDWLTSKTLDLVDQKPAARLAGDGAEYKRLTVCCKDRVQQDKQQWADTIAELAEQNYIWNRVRLKMPCTIAPDLFLVPMDWLMERTVPVHGGMVGTTIGKKKGSFTDLEFADGVVLLAEMLSVLVLALEVMDREAHPLGFTINWAKTKIQNLGDQDGANQLQYTTVGGNQVEVVESFTYLGSLIHVSRSWQQ